MMRAAEAPSVSGEELTGVMFQPISGKRAAAGMPVKAGRRDAILGLVRARDRRDAQPLAHGAERAGAGGADGAFRARCPSRGPRAGRVRCDCHSWGILGVL